MYDGEGNVSSRCCLHVRTSVLSSVQKKQSHNANAQTKNTRMYYATRNAHAAKNGAKRRMAQKGEWRKKENGTKDKNKNDKK